MLIKTFCAEVMGLEATTITIEVSLTRGVKFRSVRQSRTWASNCHLPI